MAEDQLFYVGLKALIEKDGEVLVMHDPNMGIDLPGGKIQQGETDFSEVLHREVEEETGLKIEILNPLSLGYFKFPKKVKHRHAGKVMFIVFIKAKYVSGVVRLSEEHDSYQWVNKENYLGLKEASEKNNNIFAALKTFFRR